MDHFLASGMHWRIFNFAVFLGILIFVLRKPLSQFWKSRAHQIQFQMDESRNLRVQEEERYGALSRRLKGIETEVKDLVGTLLEEGDLEKSRMVAEAERYATKLKSDGEKIAAQEVRKAREILKEETVRLSVELAEKLIQDKIGSADQKRLAEGYLARLEGPA